MDFPLFVKDPGKKVRSLVKKITHSGETELDKSDLKELKQICKISGKDDLVLIVYKECMQCLTKEHSQVRVSTVKLIDYFFQKSHLFREKVLDNFDIFLELTLAITQKPKVKLKLPPPKRFVVLLQELTAKLINSWNSDFGDGYEKIRYIYKYLREHRLVDFSAFRVQNQEELIKRQKLVERQEKILTQTIENRLREFQLLKPEIEQLLVQIESLLELLLPDTTRELLTVDDDTTNLIDHQTHKQQHGITNLSQNIQIEFNPYIEIQKNPDNKDVFENLKELKKQLVECKLTKLIAIEKTLIKRSNQFVNTVKEIIDIKTKSMNLVLKLGELQIVKDSEKVSTLDNANSESDEEDFEMEEVEPKEDLETYIPKSMRFEYGLEAIDPKELEESRKVTLMDESFSPEASSSKAISINNSLVMTCNVRMESGKLCPRRDKIKCPFHGRIIARDHRGVPINEDERRKEEQHRSSAVPDWQDPELLREIEAATGIDLKMPKKNTPNKRLANTRTCDLTPKKRLEKRLKMLKQ